MKDLESEIGKIKDSLTEIDQELLGYINAPESIDLDQAEKRLEVIEKTMAQQEKILIDLLENTINERGIRNIGEDSK
jgi:urease accessory protein UreE